MASTSQPALSLLIGNSQPPLPNPKTIQETCFEALDKWSQSSPPREFLFEMYNGKRHSFAELRFVVDKISATLCSLLANSASKPVTRIGLCLPDTFDTMALMLGMIGAPGVCVVHLPPTLGPNDFVGAWKATNFSMAFMLVSSHKMYENL